MTNGSMYPEKLLVTLEKQGSTNNYNYYEANFEASSQDIAIISSRADEIILLGQFSYLKEKSICFLDESSGKTLLRVIYNIQDKIYY